MERMRDLGLDISEGTLYPLLMRLTKDGSIAASWETPEVGHPRKYYTITSLGATLLSAMIEEYDRSQAVRTGISGGGKAE